MVDVNGAEISDAGSPGDPASPRDPGDLKYPLDQYVQPDFVDAPLTDQQRHDLARLSDVADAVFGDLVVDPAEQFRRACLRIVRD